MGRPAAPVTSVTAEPIGTSSTLNRTLPVGMAVGTVVSVTVTASATGSPQTGAVGDVETVTRVASTAKASGVPMARLAAKTTTAPAIRR